MTFYDKSIIYKIKHNLDYDNTNIYIGSTSNFKQRKYNHKITCYNEKKRQYNIPVYQYIRDHGGWESWVMIPIEEYPCNSKNELLIRERYYIDLLRPTLNIQLPGRTDKEWYEDNKEKIAEKAKKYRNANKEQILERGKKYYEDNKEQLAEYQKIYRDVNREQINEKAKEKVICDHCGCEIRKSDISKHKKTKKCINFVKTE